MSLDFIGLSLDKEISLPDLFDEYNNYPQILKVISQLELAQLIGTGVKTKFLEKETSELRVVGSLAFILFAEMFSKCLSFVPETTLQSAEHQL